MDLDDARDLVEVLDGDIVELRIRAGDQVVEGDGQAGAEVVGRVEEIDDAHPRMRAGDHQRVREDHGVGACNPVVHLDAALNDLVVAGVAVRAEARTVTQGDQIDQEQAEQVEIRPETTVRTTDGTGISASTAATASASATAAKTAEEVLARGY